MKAAPSARRRASPRSRRAAASDRGGSDTPRSPSRRGPTVHAAASGGGYSAESRLRSPKRERPRAASPPRGMEGDDRLARRPVVAAGKPRSATNRSLMFSFTRCSPSAWIYARPNAILRNGRVERARDPFCGMAVDPLRAPSTTSRARRSNSAACAVESDSRPGPRRSSSANVDLRVESLHQSGRIFDGCKTILLIEAMCISRSEHPAAEPLKLRVSADHFDEPLAKPTPSIRS